jgi:hypothetical protein
MSIDALPTPPSRDDPANFAARGDAFLAALPNFQGQANDTADAVNADAAAAAASAAAAATSEANALDSANSAQASSLSAAQSASAVPWVSGTTYAIGDVRWSPVNGRIYRRITNGAGTTDPSLDATNWLAVGFASPTLVAVSAVSVTMLAGFRYLLQNVAASTAYLPGSPSVGDFVSVAPGNGRNNNVINRNGQLIMSLAEDCTIGDPDETVDLIFEGGSRGWRISDV